MPNNLPSNPDSSGIMAEAGPSTNGLPGGAFGSDLALDNSFLAEPPSGGGGLGRYVATLIRYKWWALAVLGLGVLAGMLASRTVRPTYLVQAKVWFDRDMSGGRGPIQEGQLLDSQSWIDLLRSYAVLDEVVQQQRLYLILESGHKGLFKGFQLRDRFRPGEYRIRPDPAKRTYVLETKAGAFVERAPIGDSLGRTIGFSWVPPRQDIDENRGVTFSVRRPRDRARELGNQIVTTMAPKDARFLEIELRGKDPAVLAATLNAVVHRFVDLAAELKRSRLNELAAILSDQLRVAEQNLQSAEMGLENLRINTITQPTDAPNATASNSTDARSPLVSSFMTQKLQQEQFRQDRTALQRAMARAAANGLSVTELQAIQAVQTAPELEAALNELTTKRASLRSLQYRYTDDFGDIKRLKTELQTLEQATIPQMVADLIDELGRRDAQVESTLATTSNEMRAIPPRVMEEARLSRQVSIADNIYTMLRQRHEEARLAALSSTPDVRIVDEAIPPHSAIKDERMRLMMLAVLFSIGIIVAGVLLLDKMDPHVRYPEHVTHGMRLPILAAIPRLKNRRTGDGAANTSAVVEAFRTLRLSVLQARGNQGTFVLSITSPGTGDGKSFVAMNLAFALADQGYRTLLIDGDVRRGGLHHLVGTNRKPGLTDLLSGNVSREDAIRRTPYPLLDVIPSGKRLQTGPELLGSPALADLIQQVRPSYSVVLIDSPPLGAGIDPFVLGMAAGTLLLVLRTGQSDREFTSAKLAALDRLPIRILGAVLNGVPTERAYRYYHYLPGYDSGEEKIEADAARLPVPT